MVNIPNGHFGMIAAIFWGLWLFPLACLILKSDFIPKIIGILLIAAGCCHIIEFLVFFLCHNFDITVIQPILYAIEMIGEFSLVLWLLIKGIKNNMKETNTATTERTKKDKPHFA